MPARVIALISGKGGTGKTTVTAALAVHATATGELVTLVDAEPQQSLGLWWERRGSPGNPDLVTIDSERDLTKTVGKLRATDRDWVLIDTPPALFERIEAAVAAADFVLIPVRASIMDVEAIAPITALCGDYGKPYAFVMSAADAKWKNLDATIDALGDFGDVLEEQIRYHESHAVAITTGKAASELKGKAAADAREEIAALWKAIKRRLSGKPARGRA